MQSEAEDEFSTGAYVCLAFDSRWRYGVVLDLPSPTLPVRLRGDDIQISTSDTPLFPVDFLSYVLRPFELALTTDVSKDTIMEETKKIVDRFTRGERDTVKLFDASNVAATVPPGCASIHCFDKGWFEVTIDAALNHVQDTLHGRGIGHLWHRDLFPDPFRTDHLTRDQVKTFQIPTEWIVDLDDTLEGTTLDTSKLAKALTSYGGFPSSLFVRKEMKTVWRLMQSNFLGPARRPMALVGSPGVGKSALLVLFCCYLATSHGVKVLLARAIKTDGDTVDSDVVLSLNKNQVTAYRCHVASLCLSFSTFDQQDKVLLVGDGYVQSDFKRFGDVSVFKTCRLLSTSGQYQPTPSDQDCTLVAVPAWACNDLAATVLGNTNVQVRYAYSGGSVRDFHAPLEILTARTALNDVAQDATLALVFGLEGSRGRSIDSFRRLYVCDVDADEAYTTPDTWKFVVDSSVVSLNLVLKASLSTFTNALKLLSGTKNGSLQGGLFEQTIHALAAAKKLRLVIHRDNDETQTQDLTVDETCTFTLGSTTRKGCLAELQAADWTTKYWVPRVPNFPAIDSVIVQGGCVYLIQVKVSPKAELEANWIEEIKECFPSRYSNFALVIVSPHNKRCKITNAPPDIALWRGYAVKTDGVSELDNLDYFAERE